MQLLPRVRLILARHPAIYWIAVIVIAAVIGATVAAMLRRVEETRRSWGRTVEVWVVTAPAGPGEPLRAEARRYPAAMVPASAVVEDPGAALARQRVEPGEIVLGDDVDAHGVAGLVPTGWLALAVPGPPGPHLQVGADVVAFAAGGRLAEGRVVAVDAQQVIVAVPAESAPALTEAVGAGTVLLALAG